jgi:hypothetical protein
VSVLLLPHSLVSAPCRAETHSTVYGFCLNTLTLIHWSYFNEDERFYTVVCDSLQNLHLFAGLNNASMKVGHTILLALVNKIASQRATLTSDTNFDSQRWVRSPILASGTELNRNDRRRNSERLLNEP